MEFDLDGEGAKHAQLTRALRGCIASGLLQQGDRLPPTRDIALRCALSRNTVRMAFAQLLDEGLIQSRAGAGSFVANQILRSSRPTQQSRVPPTSAYAARLRSIADFQITRATPGLRYNLQYGEPILDPVAMTSWRAALSAAAQTTSPNYPHPQGHTALRQAVCEYLRRRRGLDCTIDDILIVNGTQQAISLCAQVLLDPGASVAVEDPHYFSARHAFHAHGANIRFAPTDAHGITLSSLYPDPPRLVMVTPAHQFPGGVRMSAARRSELLHFAQQHQCWILEDDYDSEFRFDRAAAPALRALDASRVIYAGSFSKVMFPSLRLGYMVIPAALKSDFVRAKRVSDFGSPAIEQAAMAHYMRTGAFERHLRRNVKLVRERREAMMHGLRQLQAFDIQDTNAGMHLVAWMPEHDLAGMQRLITTAQEHQLGLHPIQPHYHRPPRTPGLLVGYAALSPKQIADALVVLAGCMKRLRP